MKELIGQIEKQTGYLFIYDENEEALAHEPAVKTFKGDMRKLLSLLLDGTEIDYTIEGKHVILTRKSPANKPVRQPVVKRKVRGVVKDALGEPLVGCTVTLKGTKTATVTDVNGGYSIEAPAENGRLEFSFLGFRSQEISVGARNEINVTLEEDLKKLNEVVVVGYGTQRKALVTNAISTFKPNEGNLRPVLFANELLQGRVAGVTVSPGSGNLGSGERMSIRGAASLSASNEPLYVVDGVPILNGNASLFNMGESLSSMAVLNISDIESIEVLKDAASAAIYGSRATNGVVLITTKSGREGRTDVRLNVSSGISRFANKGRVKYADSDLYVEVFNDGVARYNRQNDLAVGSKGYIVPISNPFQNLPDTDWLDLITRIAFSYNADLSFSGGNQKTKFYVGANYNNQEGIIKTNQVTKINLKSKISYAMTPWLTIGANMSGNYMRNNRVPGANIGSTILARAMEQRPFDRPYKPNGEYYVGGTDELTRHNPLQILNEETTYVDLYRFLGIFHADFKFNRFKLHNSLNTDVGYTYDYVYYNANHPYGAGGGRIAEYNRFERNILVENVVSYDNQFGNMEFGAMLGHSFQKSFTRTSFIDGRGFPSPMFDVLSTAAEIHDATGGVSEYAIDSYFGRISLSYLDRYVLNATLRSDGSSRFAPSHRYGYFPSISFGWNVSKESFWLFPQTDLKFRLSYGKTGNQDGIGNYGWRSLMSGGQNYQNKSGIAISSLGNTTLTWETADQYNAGFDLAFWNGKLNMTFDAYLKNTNNLLYLMPLHGTTGFTGMMNNIGSMRNYGIEFSVNGHLNIGKLAWTSSFNISYNRNKLTKLLGNDLLPIGDNRALKVGKGLGSFYLFKMEGIYQYDGEVPQPQYDLGVRAGDVKYEDVDHNGIINDFDRQLVGSSSPDVFGGWNNTFRYKGFQLDVFFTYMLGNDVYAEWKRLAARPGQKWAITEDVAKNRWTGPGSTNKYPRAVHTLNAFNVKNSTRFLEDGSFVRLRSLILSYSFPMSLLTKIHLKGLRVYMQGDNLLLFSKYSGWDPEVSKNLDPRFMGMDAYGVPPSKTINFGVNLQI
ncbi:SusC/RagA family TonB-linked outer membrane protein [Prevotella sp. oral taxon 820]|nr:SusC/RagA family TonB-linked outer membrane protein [Prevotella sp. oral taxon 820]